MYFSSRFLSSTTTTKGCLVSFWKPPVMEHLPRIPQIRAALFKIEKSRQSLNGQKKVKENEEVPVSYKFQFEGKRDGQQRRCHLLITRTSGGSPVVGPAIPSASELIRVPVSLPTKFLL